MNTRRWVVTMSVAGISMGVAVHEARALGACCLADECRPAVDEGACSAMGGFFMDGADCADDPCGTGACCAELTCVMTDAYRCLMGARDFQGAGTDCADDPCAISVGACCVVDECSIVEEDECLAADGTWLGPGSNCVLDPCDLGACCLGEECLDGPQYECAAAGGEFIPGAACETDPCAEPDDCPPGSLYSQTKDGPDDFNGYTSEASTGIIRFDDFFGAAGSIEGVLWWGFDLIFDGTGFIECEELDPPFDITFYTDAGGYPGPAVCSYTLIASRTPLGITYLGAELNEYKAVLPEPCVLVNGWVSIVGRGDPDCRFMWLSGGRGRSYCEGCFAPWEAEDLSFCLTGPVGGVFGACCDDTTAMCTDDVDITQCVEADQRFSPGKPCDDLEPACGIVLGACCFDDASCSLEIETDCQDLGGNWLGGWTLCERCPCLTPCPGGGVAEGEPVCYDGYEDLFNGGCDGAVEAFSPIALCEAVCGQSGVFVKDGDFVPDYDWYEIEITTATLLTWTVEAEFEVGAWVIDGRAGCAGAVILGAQGQFECTPASVTVAVDPGTYWLVVGPLAASDAATCGAHYVARATASGGCPGDCDGDGTVTLADYPLFEACMLGPDGGVEPGCTCADINGDGAVDLQDGAGFQRGLRPSE